MSSKKVNIEIKPSEYCFDEEHFEIGGFVCSNCNGKGKVKAVVSIKWKSD